MPISPTARFPVARVSSQESPSSAPLTPAEHRPQQPPARKPLAMRKFRISSLTPEGDIRSTDQIGPVMPVFEAPFSAFARGTLIKTSDGPVAAEDLCPGMELITAEFGPMPLLWHGSMTLVPEISGMDTGGATLVRINADSFGLARPAGDLIAGPGLRLLTRLTEPGDIVGADKILTPAADLADGINIIQIAPPTPVNVFHICLARHATIYAADLEVESFHPGPAFERDMGPNMLSLFLSFFPHIKRPSDFGPLAHPRLGFDGQSQINSE